jgi:hypothetical protein
MRQDRPTEMNEIKAEVVELIKRLAKPHLTEETIAITKGRLRYVLGVWA